MRKTYKVIPLFVLSVLCASTAFAASSPTGLWGTPTPISNHPNLFWNQSEINQLRQMILVDQSPQHLVDAYNTHHKGKMAVTPPGNYHSLTTAQQNQNYSQPNVAAAISYMIEPTTAKAQAIKNALLAYDGLVVKGGGIEDGYSAFATTLMYDLVYNDPVMSAADKSAMRAHFNQAAGINNFLDNDDGDGKIFNKEGGKRVEGYINFWTLRASASVLYALCSGNQSRVNFWLDSGWPHDDFVVDGNETGNRFDLGMMVRQLYPSGANYDTYERGKWTSFATNECVCRKGWDSTVDGMRPYNWLQSSWYIMAMEAAYRNGMTGIFDMQDPSFSSYSTPNSAYPNSTPYPANYPSGLRYHLFGSYADDFIAKGGVYAGQLCDTTGSWVMRHGPAWAGYRRYSHPKLDEEIAILGDTGTITGIGNMVIFGYPRDVVFDAGGTPPPPPPPGPSIHSVSAEQSGNPASNILDGDTSDSSRWSAEGFPQWVILDQGSNPPTIDTSAVWTFQDRAYQYQIWASDSLSDVQNEVAGALVVNRSGNTSNVQPIDDSFAASDYRYVKIKVTGASGYTGNWVSLTELVLVDNGSGSGGNPTTYEAESLSRSSGGATTSLNGSGTWVNLNANSTNDWVEFTLPNVSAGTYTIKVNIQKFNNGGIAQTSVGGSNLGGTHNWYSGSSTADPFTVGTTTFGTTGNKTIRFTVTGKDGASSGYKLAIDKIILE